MQVKNIQISFSGYFHFQIPPYLSSSSLTDSLLRDAYWNIICESHVSILFSVAFKIVSNYLVMKTTNAVKV